ncbi:hypothetical protein [Bradyrhizobium sp. CCBAU 51753]|uniref:hypothetical protein n=1 Tax=Bradyrhizobium sp. CCBAU 51753 TaxID=1325100 RepID=UPI00188D3994|nr:hypothetical protein [Bradyrhizobium sp. CCBAU 51753]QOZ28090.1 hypothetical protein XH93_34110 [Bradyrhizobium sp. CCBAU 51753]
MSRLISIVWHKLHWTPGSTVIYVDTMGNGSDIFGQMLRACRPAQIRGRLRHWLEAIDGDFAFRMVVMTAGMVSTVAFAFGLLSP